MYQEDRIQKFTVGNATFKNTPLTIKEIIEKSKEIQTVLKNNQWYIRLGAYQEYIWKQMFLNMSKCSAQLLNLSGNDRVQIISQIQHIQYSNLKQLFLDCNKINNIQSLSSIHFNQLQKLCLSNNKISQIKCLNKLSTPSLNSIYLNSNPLIEINALTRSKINSKLLQILGLQLYKPIQITPYINIPINQDLSVIVKLSYESIKQLGNLLINMRHKFKQKNQSSSNKVNVKVEIPFYFNLQKFKIILIISFVLFCISSNAFTNILYLESRQSLLIFFIQNVQRCATINSQKYYKEKFLQNDLERLSDQQITPGRQNQNRNSLKN